MVKRILFLDDDISMRDSISLYLISQKFSVSLTDNVVSALNELNNNIPDLVIADIMMPDIDGYSFLEILRSNNSFHHIPFIFLTAKGMTNDRIKGYDAGCNAYLTKPFDPSELLSIINNLLKRQQSLNKTLNVKTSTMFNDKHSLINSLTSREKAVLKLVVRGYKNKEVADELQISIRSIEKYVSRLLQKTSTRNRTELAQFIGSSIIKLYKGE
uniref:TctD transcriptional regulator n=2 Tax=Kappaphycus TaxID=38543 RepID=A0A8E7UFV6_9FLOR|nr:hypothetical protein [Kappaphycus striatus]